MPDRTFLRRCARAALAAVFALALCAGTAGFSQPARADADPLASLNRGLFHLNSWFAGSVVAPLGEGLSRTAPKPLKLLAGNMFANLTEPEAIVGHYLAGHEYAASQAARRFIINSTLGFGSMLDVASRLDIHAPHLPFGAAVCQAGVPTRPYTVLPLIGPSNLAVAGTTTGFLAGGFWLFSRFSTTLAAADLVIDVSAAASLRHVGELPDSASADPYQTQRQQYRAYLREECPRLPGGTPG